MSQEIIIQTRNHWQRRSTWRLPGELETAEGDMSRSRCEFLKGDFACWRRMRGDLGNWWSFCDGFASTWLDEGWMWILLVAVAPPYGVVVDREAAIEEADTVIWEGRARCGWWPLECSRELISHVASYFNLYFRIKRKIY